MTFLGIPQNRSFSSRSLNGAYNHKNCSNTVPQPAEILQKLFSNDTSKATKKRKGSPETSRRIFFSRQNVQLPPKINLFGHHHLDELLVVDLTITINIGFANHLINL